MGTVGRIWLLLAGLSGAMAVAAGAYATHALAAPEQEYARELARMASQFQLWHALALGVAALLARMAGGAARGLLRLSGWLFVVGMALFCGTLYAQALGYPPPVPMTAPTGGTSFILGWLALGVAALLPGWAARP